MLWFGTYTTDKDTVLVDCQTRAEVRKVINEIVGKTDSVSLLTSNHANSLSESLRPHLKNVMTSCYERETLLVAEYPHEKRQHEELDDSSESEHKKIVRTSMAISRRSKIASWDFRNLGIWRVVSNYPKPRPKF